MNFFQKYLFVSCGKGTCHLCKQESTYLEIHEYCLLNTFFCECPFRVLKIRSRENHVQYVCFLCTIQFIYFISDSFNCPFESLLLQQFKIFAKFSLFYLFHTITEKYEIIIAYHSEISHLHPGSSFYFSMFPFFTLV